ncbi:MAG: hypothetical protein QM775_07495 [Pirellulales bacterium]
MPSSSSNTRRRREAAAARRLEGRTPLENPLDVLAQHVVTMALGEGFDAASLYDEVRTTHAFRKLTPEQWRWTLDFVERGGPAYVLTRCIRSSCMTARGTSFARRKRPACTA